MKTLSIEIGSEPPSRVRLFKAGENETAKGTFIYDPKLKVLLEAEYVNKDGRDKLPVDYAHNSLKQHLASPEAGISAGWGDISFEETGIYYNNLEWTARALEYIKNKEYRFISPAFDVDENGYITKIINFALTNNPATYNAVPLVADKSSNLNEDSMSKKDIKQEEDKETAVAAEQKEEPVAEEKEKEVQLEEDTSDKEKELQEDEEEVKKEMTIEQAMEMVKGLEKQRDELSLKLSEALEKQKELQEQLAAYEKEKESAEIEEVLDAMSLSDSERVFLSSNMSLETLKGYAKVHKPTVVKQEEEAPKHLDKKMPQKKGVKTECLEIPNLPSREQIKKEAEEFAKRYKR